MFSAVFTCFSPYLGIGRGGGGGQTGLVHKLLMQFFSLYGSSFSAYTAKKYKFPQLTFLIF